MKIYMLILLLYSSQIYPHCHYLDSANKQLIVESIRYEEKNSALNNSNNAHSNSIIQEDTINAFWSAIRQNDIRKVNALLNSHPHLILFLNEREPVLYILTSGHSEITPKEYEIIDLLIAQGFDVNKRNSNGFCTESGWTPLYTAICYRKYKLAELYISRGADVNLKIVNNSPPTSIYGDTALHMAAREFAPEELITQLITRGAEIDALDEQRNTPLHIACERNHFQAVKILLAKGAHINQKNCSGNTPLHLASYPRRGSESVEILIRNGADVTAKNNKGNTPLHNSVVFSHIPSASNQEICQRESSVSKEIADLLIKNGAILEVNNYDNQTPIDLAKKVKNYSVAKFLENYR